MNRREFHNAALVSLATAMGGSLGQAQETETGQSESTGPWNLPSKTFGGMQFWADQLFFHDWRIQRNAVTGHCRLLDTNGWRHAWGSFEECRAKLDQIRRAKQLSPMQGAGVLVMHGLGRTRNSMKKMAAMLHDQGKYTVFNVTYPSTRYIIAEHARSLARIIQSLEGITQINFVCHSLGNLIVRYWLAESGAEEGGLQSDQRIQRMVMLGPPNHRPELASTAAKIDFTGQIGGKTLAQLSKGWDQLEPHLATP
ncbi:MAG: alpha/beta fold hydrolase, partial [Pirellulales bacterium]|nr:alpha/beta fold hydrolase [Pirellulales bacterium]